MESMNETVCLVSLGCAKNLVDSEVMLGLLSKAGYHLTTDPSKAEIIVVNTCSFIQDATKEAIDTILQSPVTRGKASAAASLFQDACPNVTGKPWRRNFQRWISSSAPGTSETFLRSCAES